MPEVFAYINTDLTEDFDSAFFMILYKHLTEFLLKSAIVKYNTDTE